MFKKINFGFGALLSIVASFLFFRNILFPAYIGEAPYGYYSIKGYKKNSWTSQKTIIDNGNYIHTYKFKDLTNETHIWKWSTPQKASDEIIKNYGIPQSIFEPYIPTKENIDKRNKQMQKGFFRSVNQIVMPDYSSLISTSRPLLGGLTSLVKKTKNDNSLSHRETIELIMSFCQDIPYGIPPEKYKGKITSGMFPPTQVLNNKWGDCDSKAMLFVATYLSIPKARSIVLLESPGHLSVGIEGIPGPYDNAVAYGGKKYIFAEPVGPGKIPLGQPLSPYVQVKMAYPIKLKKAITEPSFAFYSEAKTSGNSIIFNVQEGNKSLGKKLKIFYNHKGQNYNYYELTASVRKDGTIKFSSEQNKIFLMINHPGYYHYGNYELTKNTRLDINFSKEKCIYIKTSPGKNIFLFQRKDGKYSGLQFQADSKGIVRAILESGDYIATTTQQITGKFKRFDKENKKGISFSL